MITNKKCLPHGTFTILLHPGRINLATSTDWAPCCEPHGGGPIRSSIVLLLDLLVAQGQGSRKILI